MNDFEISMNKIRSNYNYICNFVKGIDLENEEYVNGISLYNHLGHNCHRNRVARRNNLVIRGKLYIDIFHDKLIFKEDFDILFSIDIIHSEDSYEEALFNISLNYNVNVPKEDFLMIMTLSKLLEP